MHENMKGAILIWVEIWYGSQDRIARLKHDVIVEIFLLFGTVVHIMGKLKGSIFGTYVVYELMHEQILFLVITLSISNYGYLYGDENLN